MIVVENIKTVNYEKYKGWKTYKIGRPTIFGNMFITRKDGTRKDVVKKYRIMLNQNRLKEGKLWDEVVKLAVHALKNNILLLCYCAPKQCHGDVIKSAIEWLHALWGHKEQI